MEIGGRGARMVVLEDSYHMCVDNDCEIVAKNVLGLGAALPGVTRAGQ